MKRITTADRLRQALRYILLGALLFGLALQLHVGIADNGDFTRLMPWVTSGPSGFVENWPAEGSQAHHDRFFNNVLAFWKLDMPLSSRWISSILLLWLPGVLLNLIFYSSDVLYLPILNAAPRLAVLLFLWLLLRRIEGEDDRVRVLLYLVMALPLVFMFFDTSYVAYFTSFFQEPASLLGLMSLILVIALYSGEGDTRWRPWITGAAMLFMTTAKVSNLHWALLGTLLLIPWKSLWHQRQRLGVYIVLVTLIPLGIPLLQGSLYGTRTVNAYQSIYCGALMFSDDARPHLERIGMPDGEQYIGYHAYCDEGREAMQRYPDRLSHRITLDIILHEPTVAWDMLHFAADSMQMSELTHLSKHVLYNDPHGSKPWPRWLPATAAAATPFNTWTRLKASVFPTGTALVVVVLLLLAIFIWLRRRGSGLLNVLATVGILLSLATLSDMWIQILGDGQRDLIKHLYLANICFDGSVIAFLGSVVLAVFAPKALRRKHPSRRH